MNNNQFKKNNPLMTKSVQPEKHSHVSQQYQSLLVSSINYQPSQSNPDSADHRLFLKHSQGTLIKKNIIPNIVVQDVNKCHLEHKVQAIASSLQMLSLTVQQLQSKLNICFTKQAALGSSLTQNTCKMQQRQQTFWEMEANIKDQQQKNIRTNQQLSFTIKGIADQINLVKKTLSRLQNKESQKCLASRLVEHKLQKYKGQQDKVTSTILQSFKQIGLLQKKIMVTHSQRQVQTFADEQSIWPRQGERIVKMKVLKGGLMGRKRTCQSTNISYSRNLDNSK